MPTYNTTAIVLGRTNFGEADRIIRLLTPEHGKMSAVAKGVRRIKSKSGGHLEPLGEVGLMLAVGRNLDVITSARLKWYPHTLITDYPRLELATMAAMLVDRMAPEGESNQALYEHLRHTLELIEAGEQGSVLELWFKLRLLALTGLQPGLDHCLVCGRRDAEATYALDPDHGGLVCHGCRGAVVYPMPAAAIKLWRLAPVHTYDSIKRLGGAEAMARASLPACDGFFEAHTGRSSRLGG